MFYMDHSVVRPPYVQLNPWFWSLVLCLSRRLRSVRRGPRRGSAGEVSVRSGGVRAEPVSQPTQQVREAAAASAFPPHRLLLGHRAALLRASGGKDPDRDSDQRHAAVRQQLQLALHAYPVERGGRERGRESSSSGATEVRKRSHTSHQVISPPRKMSAALKQREEKLPEE